MADVAEAAKVSKSTVSRVFAAPESVREDTRARVLAVAQRLGFAPNRMAQSLASGRTGAFGLIVPDVVSPFFAEIIKSVQGRARRKDLAVFIADTDEHVADEPDLVQAFAGQVDGLILASPRMSLPMLSEAAASIPTVLINREAAGIPAVVGSTASAMRQAIEHLAALGHHICVYVTREAWADPARDAAVAEVCGELDFTVTAILDPIEPKFEAGLAAADRVLASGATSVIAQNDLVALGLMNRLAQRGVSVPSRLSVIGLDDTFLARMTWPPLTSVRMPLGEMGSRAVDMLLRRLADPAAQAEVERVEASLIVRASTGPVG